VSVLYSHFIGFGYRPFSHFFRKKNRLEKTGSRQLEIPLIPHSVSSSVAGSESNQGKRRFEMIRNILLSGLIVLGAATATAKKPSARIDINGTKAKITLTIDQTNKVNCSPHNPAWMKTNQAFFACVPGMELKTDEWAPYEFSFTPDKDGVVSMHLMGSLIIDKESKKRNPLWVAWKDLEVIGAEAKNLDFSELKSNGLPAYWSLKPEQFIAEQKIVKSWHDGRIVQNLKVKAGQKVTIKAMVKPLQ
jgi:hypothetical protein